MSVAKRCTVRSYRGEADYQRIRELLIESYNLNQNLHNWGLDRWDFLRYLSHADDELAGKRAWMDALQMWEDDAGQLVGLAHFEDPGHMHFQVHPDTRHLEDEMLDRIEQQYQTGQVAVNEDKTLNIEVYDYDQYRSDLLARRGYTCLGPSGYKRRRALAEPMQMVQCPAGYVVRTLRLDDPDDLARLAVTSNALFGSSLTAETIRVLRHAPTYRADLDLVAVAPDGTIAALALVWFAPETRYGTFEPVGTHPAHRRMGLARAVLLAGMQRVKALGAAVMYVGVAYDTPANRLYEAVGFTEADVAYHWQRTF
ncbi:GNAT family N-acetyltransferase [Chloroflexota bacterium]